MNAFLNVDGLDFYNIRVIGGSIRVQTYVNTLSRAAERRASDLIAQGLDRRDIVMPTPDMIVSMAEALARGE